LKKDEFIRLVNRAAVRLGDPVIKERKIDDWRDEDILSPAKANDSAQLWGWENFRKALIANRLSNLKLKRRHQFIFSLWLRSARIRPRVPYCVPHHALQTAFIEEFRRTRRYVMKVMREPHDPGPLDLSSPQGLARIRKFGEPAPILKSAGVVPDMAVINMLYELMRWPDRVKSGPLKANLDVHLSRLNGDQIPPEILDAYGDMVIAGFEGLMVDEADPEQLALDRTMPRTDLEKSLLQTGEASKQLFDKSCELFQQIYGEIKSTPIISIKKNPSAYDVRNNFCWAILSFAAASNIVFKINNDNMVHK
jgi:hypothetical protein